MGVEVVFWTVVLARFALPLLIPRYPLPAIIGCLVLDAVDQTIFQPFGYDPPFYQSYDKAMDVFYLSVAYLASLRNWTNHSAVKISRFLFFYRQIGVVPFELTGAAVAAAGVPEHVRVLLHRLRRRSAPGGTRCGTAFKFWVLVAAGDLDLHQAAAGVLDPHRPAGLHRHGPGRPLVRPAVVIAPARPGRGAVVRRPAAAPAGRLAAAARAPTRCRPRSTRRASGPRTGPSTARSSTGARWRRPS